MDEQVESELNKILVYAPRTLLGISYAFPFLINLRRAFPKAEINIITHPKFKNLFQLVPGEKFRCHDYDELQYSGMMQIHKYSVNLLDVFNIDLYFSLESNFTGAFMGFTFQAKERFGLKKQMSDLFYTHKLEISPDTNEWNKFLKLLKLKTAQELENEKFKMAELPPLVKNFEENPYIVISFEDEDLEQVRAGEWSDLISLMDDQRILFLCNPEKKEQLDFFIESLPDTNTYESYAHLDDIIQVGQVMAFARGVIGQNSGVMHFAGLLGTKMCIIDSKLNSSTAPMYTHGEFLHLSPTSKLENLVDQIYRFLDLC